MAAVPEAHALKDQAVRAGAGLCLGATAACPSHHRPNTASSFSTLRPSLEMMAMSLSAESPRKFAMATQA